MGLGVIDAAEFDAVLQELEKPVVRPVAHIKNFTGRGNSKAIPKALQKVIAGEVISGARASDVAKEFGVSESSISAYKNDATSTSSYDEPDPELKQHNDLVRNEIVGNARLRLQSAIANITDAKLADAKLKDVASVARDMSAIIKNLEPERDHSDRPLTQFIYYAPKQRLEKDYEIIQVSE